MKSCCTAKCRVNTGTTWREEKTPTESPPAIKWQPHIFQIAAIGSQENESFEWPIKSLKQPPIQKPPLHKLLTTQSVTHNTKLSLNSHRNTWNDQKREDKKIRKKKPTKSLTWNFKSTWNHIASILQHFFEQPIMKPSSHFTEIKVRLQAALTACENASCKKKRCFTSSV